MVLSLPPSLQAGVKGAMSLPCQGLPEDQGSWCWRPGSLAVMEPLSPGRPLTGGVLEYADGTKRSALMTQQFPRPAVSAIVPRQSRARSRATRLKLSLRQPQPLPPGLPQLALMIA